MVYKCCVTNCRGNYPDGPKVTVFRFPQDEKLKEKWLKNIRRENLTLTNHTRVCELHFNSDYVKTSTAFRCENGQEVQVPLNHPHLVPEAVPTIFYYCPKYLSSDKEKSQESPQTKRRKKGK